MVSDSDSDFAIPYGRHDEPPLIPSDDDDDDFGVSAGLPPADEGVPVVRERQPRVLRRSGICGSWVASGSSDAGPGGLSVVGFADARWSVDDIAADAFGAEPAAGSRPIGKRRVVVQPWGVLRYEVLKMWRLDSDVPLADDLDVVGATACIDIRRTCDAAGVSVMAGPYREPYRSWPRVCWECLSYQSH
jgi:hypothetical protein